MRQFLSRHDPHSVGHIAGKRSGPLAGPTHRDQNAAVRQLQVEVGPTIGTRRRFPQMLTWGESFDSFRAEGDLIGLKTLRHRPIPFNAVQDEFTPWSALKRD